MRLLVFIIAIIMWFVLGFIAGSKYEKENQYTERHYVYKNGCFTIYNGAVMEYDCLDTLIESE